MSDKTKSKNKQCEECRTTKSQKFHLLKNKKWRYAERNNSKVTVEKTGNKIETRETEEIQVSKTILKRKIEVVGE
ncbi:hypothetical protein C2G38_2165461 [Gigaspora rosea]|uniref:Uncharacterized protein n=1 Tax=Gigaspora rosea TaxID=44941 RepID=A0A397VWE3_9GLOM|nr:hypothetical protein C2G38_2165461 [Gigaspora rosea]CAG8748490.1 1919_t:CDS:2 [Gigaspora rosea]